MLPYYSNGSTFAPLSIASRNRLDALFKSLTDANGSLAAQAWSRFPVAMWQDDDNIHIEAELPGIAEEDVELTVHDGQVYIRAQRKPEPGRDYLHNSRWFGAFERVVALPEAVDTAGVEATLTNGVLHVDFPKAAEAKPKKISLKKS